MPCIVLISSYIFTSHLFYLVKLSFKSSILLYQSFFSIPLQLCYNLLGHFILPQEPENEKYRAHETPDILDILDIFTYLALCFYVLRHRMADFLTFRNCIAPYCRLCEELSRLEPVKLPGLLPGRGRPLLFEY